MAGKQAARKRKCERLWLALYTGGRGEGGWRRQLKISGGGGVALGGETA